MTYKKIVEGLIEKEIARAINKLLKETNKDNFFIWETEIENDTKTDKDHIFFKATITLKEGTGFGFKKKIIVGGTVDDSCGICPSVIWDGAKENILWMFTESARAALDIKEFKF